jgi:hypothetical protein
MASWRAYLMLTLVILALTQAMGENTESDESLPDSNELNDTHMNTTAIGGE